jgi:hypothetical protein
MNWDINTTIISVQPLRSDLDILPHLLNEEQAFFFFQQNTFRIHQTTFCRTALPRSRRSFVSGNLKTKIMEQNNTKSALLRQPKKILTTKFNYNIPSEELRKIMPSVAPKFSEIPGCYWKIWLISDEQKTAGGVYLFESATKLEEFLKSKLFASVKNNPAFSNLETNAFDVEQAASEITVAPLMKRMFNNDYLPFPWSKAAGHSYSRS